jgi:hypothetical protein
MRACPLSGRVRWGYLAVRDALALAGEAVHVTGWSTGSLGLLPVRLEQTSVGKSDEDRVERS